MPKRRRRKHTWLIMDGRYWHAPDDALCMVACSSLDEARSYGDDYGECVIVRYEIGPPTRPGDDGTLLNPVIVGPTVPVKE